MEAVAGARAATAGRLPHRDVGTGRRDLWARPSAPNSMTRHRPASGANKPRPKWAPTVERPSAQETPTAPALLLNVRGKEVRSSNLRHIDLDEVRAARKFVGAETNRNKPARPTLERLGLQCDVESDAEAVEAHLLDRDPDVVRLIAQPFWLKRKHVVLRHGQERQSWTWVCPDFLVEKADGSLEAVEVKRFGINLEPAVKSKFLAVREACRDAGMEFSLREGLQTTERQIFALLSIYKRTRHLPLQDVTPFRDAVLKVAEHGATLMELWALDEHRISKPLIWWMVWHGDLCFDWTAQVDSNTVVRLHGPQCDEYAGPAHPANHESVCGPHQRQLIGPVADQQGTAREHLRSVSGSGGRNG